MIVRVCHPHLSANPAYSGYRHFVVRDGDFEENNFRKTNGLDFHSLVEVIRPTELP